MVERSSGLKTAATCAVVVLIIYAFSCSASVSVSLLSSVKEVAPGTFVTEVFAVKNGGTTTDTFLLTFATPAGWEVHGTPESITLSPGDEESVFATITVPAGAVSGQYEIGFTAVSESDPADSATVVAEITVSPLNEVEVSPPSGKSGVPGKTVEYEVTIVNRGNVQDSFVIEACSSLGFPVTLSTGSLDLAPQEQISVRISLKIPEDASPGHDLLTIKVSSSLYAGVEDEASLSTTILPPGPEGIGGTLIETLPARIRLSIHKDLFSGSFNSRLSFSLSGRVLDGFFSASISASNLFGPDPLNVSYYSITYRREPASYGVGNVSKRLTDLVSLSCAGGQIEIDEEYYDLVLIGGGWNDQTRFAGRIAVGPEEANLGVCYFDVRTATLQKAIWSATAEAEPLPDWSIRAEGALGIDAGLTSRAFFFHTGIDTEGYFLSGDAFSIGTFFPGSGSDTAGIELSQRLRTDSLSISLSLSHGWDNVISDPLIPTSITDELGFNLQANPLDDGPTLTATTEFKWERYSDPTLKSEIDLLLSVGISERDGVFPYAFSAKATDRIDRVLGTHYRTLTYSQGAGISLDAFYLFLQLTEETLRDVTSGLVLSGSTDVSLTFRPEGTLHEAAIGLKNNTDRFDLSVSLTVQFTEGLQIIFDGTIGWDRADASPPSFGFGVTFNADLDIPLPFLKTKGRIEGRLFVDLDGDRTYTTADRPVGGAVIEVDGTEVSTDNHGLFRFPPLYPGTYELIVSDLPPGVLQPEPISVELHAGETLSLGVPLPPAAVVSGRVFDDADRDGVRDEGEGGFGDVRVMLRSPDGTISDAKTDPQGQFQFRAVPPGSYTVSIDRATLPDRFVYTTREEVTLVVTTESPPIVLFGGYIHPTEVVITFQPPTADFTYAPGGAKAGASVAFDGGPSFDFDGEIVSYAWDFDGDGKTDATGKTASYVFSSSGSHDVSLTVTDDDGNTDTITKTIEVGPAPSGGVSHGFQPPIADFSPEEVNPGDPVFFDGSSSLDPDSEIVSYEWDFDGDGKTDATGNTASYVFSSSGSHDVSLTVTDDDGNTDTITKTIEVGPAPSGGVSHGFQPPIADFYTPGEPDPGDPVLFDGSSSVDPDGEIVAYAWDFDGDGKVDSTAVTAEHTFPIAGSYEVSLTVTDDDGNSDTITYTIEVGGEEAPSSAPGTFVPPLAEFTYSPEAPHAGEPVEFNGMSSLDFDGEIVAYAWDFEDDGKIDATGPIVLHTFPSPGSYDVRLTVTDNDGNEDTVVHTIDVD